MVDPNEGRMAKMGRDRYRSKVRRSRETGTETFTVAGRYLLKESVARLEDALTEWKLRASLTAPGRNHQVFPYVDQVPTGVVSLITMKVILDEIARERSYTTTALTISNMIEDEARFRAYFAAFPPQARRLVKTYLATGRAKLRKRVREAVNKHRVPWSAWPRREKARLGMMLLEMVRQETGLIDVIRRPTPQGKIRMLVVPDDVSLAWLEESHERHETLFPFYLPTVVPPADWEGLDDGGYHADIVRKRSLIKLHDGSARHELENADMPEVYAAVNAVQRVGWRVNTRVLGVMSHLWSVSSTVGGLPRRDDDKPPPSPADYATNPDAAKAWRKTARLIYDRNRAQSSRRLMVSKVLYMADTYRDEVFYYPQQMDFRGRLYPIPFFLQPQGPSFARALLQFAERKPIQSEDGMDWWKIHGANTWGLDKVPFTDRLSWVNDNLERAALAGGDPLSNLWWTDADKPWEFLAWCFEAHDMSKMGPSERFTYCSTIPIQMDGSNNGLQIFSLLLRDEVGGRATNCVPGPRPNDIYQEVADVVTEKVRARAERGEPFARKWLEFLPAGVPRKAVKRPVMTLPYGSTQYSCHQYTMDWYLDARAAAPLNPFPADFHTPCWWLGQRIWESIGEVVVAATGAMDWLQKVSSAMSRARLPIRWETPVGFKVFQGYTDYETDLIKTSYGDTVRQVLVRNNGPKLSSRRQRQGISPNLVHSLDAAAMMRTITLCRERGVESFMMVHDSFGTVAQDAPRMAACLRRAYVEIFSDDVLADFRDQVLDQGVDPKLVPPLPKYGTLNVNDLLSSLYFFA